MNGIVDPPAKSDVSIVIPTYNHADYIGAAVDSALAQTRPAREVIVVDDGSTDATTTTLARYGDRIRVVAKPNGGLSSARNSGIAAAQGEWVAFLDADDALHPQLIERFAITHSALPSAAVIACRGDEGVRPQWQSYVRATRWRPIRLVDLTTHTRFPSSGAFVRHDAFDAVGNFDESLMAVEDRDMWVRLAARFEVIRIEERLAWIRDTPGSMSKDPERMERFERIVLDRIFAMPEMRGRTFARCRAYAIMNASAAVTMDRAGRPGDALRRAAAALAWWPWPLHRDDVAVPFMRLRIAVAAARAGLRGFIQSRFN